MTIQQSIPAPAPPEAAPAADATSRVTPMMEQYLEIKAAHPGLLLFYRMGDFYELFFEDAEIASKTLGIVLTKRGKHQGMDIPMCGVPVERSEDYLHRLINAGHRVAVCEQTENPAAARARGNKSVVAPRRGAAGDAGHADRRHAARCPHQQLSAGDRARPRLLPAATALGSPGSTSRPPNSWSRNARPRNSRRRWRGSIPMKSSSPTRSMAMPISARCCANCPR